MVWRFLKKLAIKPPYDPEIPLLGICPEDTKIEKDTCNPIAHCSTVYNSYNMDATYMSFDRWMDKEVVVHIHNGVFSSVQFSCSVVSNSVQPHRWQPTKDPLSLGFSRQEHWSGLPFPSPMHESEKWKWSLSVVFDSATPWTAAYQAPPSMGFFQARVLEWGAIDFSGYFPTKY